MYTKEQLEREKNLIIRKYENVLIDIMFSLLDIEDELETLPFPIENIEDKIDTLKKNIGKELKD
jgi:predicted DNA-binding ArsR family transcriptional regulator